MKRAAFAMLLALLLCACGGGDFDEDERAKTPPLDCKATPEKCL